MADLRAFYTEADGDLDEVLARLRSEERVAKFVRLFLADDNHERLMGALATGDVDAAFRATHTLKDIAGDMGFGALAATASEACEAFRAGDFARGAELSQPVDAAYMRVVEAAGRHL